MEVFELILCIVAAVVLSSFLSRFIPKVSTPLVQIALGLLLPQLPFIPDVTLDPELFMVLFIAPLLYLEAHDIDKGALLKTLSLSLSLAIGLAVATMVAVGFSLHLIWPVVPLAAALALGAALGPTDAVAVSSLSHEASLTQRQAGVLKGESLFNDASGIVGFQFAIAAAVTGRFEVGEAVGEFIVSFCAGALFGLVIGMLANWIFESMRSLGWETTTTRILLELFLPFLLYIGAEVIHVSGILAVVAAGLIIRFDRTGVGPNVARTNIVATSVWGVLSFSLNGAVFILLGMLLPGAMHNSWNNPGIQNWMLLGCIGLTALVVVGMRFLWVAAMLRIAPDATTHQRRRMTKERWRSAAVMTFGGPKGTITLSLMFTIPYTIAAGTKFPMRDELIFIASGVIIVTLLLANFMLPILAPNRGHDDSREIIQKSIELLRKTVEELAQRITPENRRVVMIVIDSYTKRITRLKHRIGTVDPAGLEQLQVETLEWEKEYIKQQLTQIHAKPEPLTAEDQMDEEACERILDQIMTTLRQIHDERDAGQRVWKLRGRMRAFTRRAKLLTKRISEKMRRTTPLVSEDEIYAHTRRMQLHAIEHVIDRLYDEMASDDHKTEFCSTLLLDYRRAEAALKARPNVTDSTAFINGLDEAKREGFSIELSIIQDMVESGDITRAQARQLRKNVYVMSVDADAAI
ncbi:Na+/H+ antiporter [Bifidobacterium gallicum]|uniref:Sodium:proton antiporter n=1 Tax=Bifidobacterium gallicum DSM 20093 = LMG 11596 TaxID=561180 RepID=A0A087AMZ0_9BIFI|nr:Na+/H+ antiporter [Bifidobacterium gallicum]KFI60140.1 sodium:proton antiporter [Bifidobacterium gallicum DSM 20093 = LMG 11596]